MKKIKVIIAIIVGLIGMIILIYGLYDKKEQQDIQLETNTSTNETSLTTSSTNTTTTKKTTKKIVKTTKKTTTKKVVKTNTNKTSGSGGYRLTHYGYDCCKSGRTATGYDISKTIYYNDATYGKVRIVAMCSKYKLYSIIKIKDYKLGGDTLAIVLDRGVGCGTIDLAVKNEKTASKYGIQNNVKIEVLRNGR